MGANAHAPELRDLIGLANKLRESAAQTGDPHYIDLFLQTAQALEARANAIAYGTPIAEPRAHIDLTC